MDSRIESPRRLKIDVTAGFWRGKGVMPNSRVICQATPDKLCIYCGQSAGRAPTTFLASSRQTPVLRQPSLSTSYSVLLSDSTIRHRPQPPQPRLASPCPEGTRLLPGTSVPGSRRQSMAASPAGKKQTPRLSGPTGRQFVSPGQRPGKTYHNNLPKPQRGATLCLTSRRVATSSLSHRDYRT